MLTPPITLVSTSIYVNKKLSKVSRRFNCQLSIVFRNLHRYSGYSDSAFIGKCVNAKIQLLYLL